MAWDVTSLGRRKPGSGGCITDSAADKLGQVQGGLGLPDRAVEESRDLRDQPAVVGG